MEIAVEASSNHMAIQSSYGWQSVDIFMPSGYACLSGPFA